MLVVTDGGKQGGITYGSYRVYTLRGEEIQHKQFVVGYGTSNQAEYIALQQALYWCVVNNHLDVTVFIDSNLVRNQVLGKWPTNHSHLEVERQKVLRLIDEFERIKIKKVGNKLIKRLLGH